MIVAGYALCGLCLSLLSLGFLGMYLILRFKQGGFEHLAKQIVSSAEQEVERKKGLFETELKQKEYELKHNLELLAEQKRQKSAVREEKLDRQLALIEKKLHEIEKKEKELIGLKQACEIREANAQAQESHTLNERQKLAGMSVTEARQSLLNQFKEEIKAESVSYLFEQNKEIEDQAGRYASTILSTAINRLSLTTINDAAVIVVSLPNHEMKGRIIGREGRNIRILEETTGVNFVIDDTPNAVLISGFDPLRKEIAKVALKELIQDGRIHPTRIEEVVAKAQKKVHSQMLAYGEEAAFQAGSLTFHPELIQLLGRLHFCYSFGQNVLAHSLEVCHLMGLMAAELKLDCERAKRIGLLHDLGKASSHELEGSHALVGEQLALKYGESLEVANGIGCHHDEIHPTTIEASLCSAANKLSGSRPGARSEPLEHYFKRSTKLEALTRQFDGVEKAYALHAGRELRVIVEPEKFDDLSLLILAKDIAKKIEKEMSYPGQIKVTVIREKRAIEYAS